MNKSVKRALSILVGIMMVFPIAGCGTKAGQNANENADSQNHYGKNIPELVFFDVKNPQQEISLFSAGLSGVSATVPKLVLRGQEDDTMPIGGFSGPDYRYIINGKNVDLLNDATFQLLEDCGINMLIHTGFYTAYGSEPTTKMLTFADSHKINYLIPDSTINIGYTKSGDPVVAADASTVGTKDEIKSSLENYANDYKYFAGFYGQDEPAEASFSSIATSWSRFNAASSELGLNNKGLTLYYNHIVCQTGYKDYRMTSAKYETYLNNYIATTGANYLLFDLYPMATYQGNTKAFWGQWLNLLGLFAAISAENNIPWWGYAQAGGNFEGAGETAFRIVSEGELNYNVNTMLAFGAKGIMYFPCCVPMGYAENDDINPNDNGLINKYGQKTPRYYYAQQINKQIQACDEYLMNCIFKGVIQKSGSNGNDGNHPSVYSVPYARSGDTYTYRKNSYGILSSVSSSASDYYLVGCFDYGDANAYYVVNDSFVDDDAAITLNFNANHNYLIIQRGVVGTLSAKRSFGLRLAAGEGAFVLELKNNNPNVNDNIVSDSGNF